jgi:hypothetical protein
LTDLQNQLTSVLLKQCRTVAIKDTDSLYMDIQKPETDICIQEGTTIASTSNLADVPNIYVNEQQNPGGAVESEFGQKRKRNPIIVTPAWCFSEAAPGSSFFLVVRSSVFLLDTS